jgi:transcriptional regulator GlxA family with amidase domain
VRKVVILAYEGAQLLDLAGPVSVFSEAAEFVKPQPYSVTIASVTGGAVRTSSGVALITWPLSALSDTNLHLVLIPGGTREGLRAILRDDYTRAWTCGAAARSDQIASVCTGAFALAEWGLLDGRRAATHWGAADALARRYPTIDVDADALFVEDDGIWTSAGVSAGTDMAIAMVERELGREVAAKVARRLVLQMRRAGHQSQFSTLLDLQRGRYGQLIEWIEQNLALDLSLDALAAKAGEAPRSFHRRFTAETGDTPAATVEKLRLERARTLLEAGQSIKLVSMRAGFRSCDHLGRAFRRAFGLTPRDYRLLHST